jgi:hypothetical protein
MRSPLAGAEVLKVNELANTDLTARTRITQKRGQMGM